jgi:multiple sugar transport system permease protein
MPSSHKIHSLQKQEKRLAWILVSPALLYLVLIMLLPFLWAIYISLTNKMVGVPGKFIGFKNYFTAIRDAGFQSTIVNTFQYTFFAVIGKVIFGTILALVVHSNVLKFKSIFRSLLLLPWTLPVIVITLTWKWMFSDVGGVLNHIFMSVGLIKSPIFWLSTAFMAKLSVIMVNIWRGTPFIGISVLAALQVIPDELYAAASIDGANVFQRFRHITIPGIKDALAIASLVTTIWTFNSFPLVWQLTRGGPADKTQIVATYSYVVGFSNYYIGRAVAISILFLPVMLILANIVTRRTLADK